MPIRSRSGDVDRPRLMHMQAPSVTEQFPPPIAEELTVALIAKAYGDLQQTHERTGLSRTDIVNRAVSLYEFVTAEQHAGSELVLRRSTGEEHVVKLL